MKNFSILILLLSLSAYTGAQEDYLPSTISRNNAYSLEFFSAIKNNLENIAVSPFGVSNCMAMAYIGSEGKTQQAIANKMNFITPYGVLVSYKQLNKRYQIYKNNEINLLIGNALWIGGDKDIQKKYKNLLKVNFGAHVEEMDFTQNDADGFKEINRWVKKASNFNFLSLIKPDEIERTDELVYTNYLYFDGSWENPFNEQLTGKEDFFMADSTKKKVDFMNQTAYLKYNENEIFQIIELPYSGQTISMIVLLPKNTNYMDSLARSLNLINFDFWTSELYTKLVSLSLPKFKIEQSYIISPFNNDSGLVQAFSEEADFSRISKNPVRLSRIIQKTTIQVIENKNSNFTESIGGSNLANPIKDNTFVKFKADHPFIFIVKDNLNNSILLIGKVNSPNFNNISADYYNY